MPIFGKKEICPICGRPIRGDVRIKIKDNVELCKVCSSEIEMDSSLIPTMSVEDIKKHLEYRKENASKMEQFQKTWGAQAGAYILRADNNMELWYFTNDRSDTNPPLFGFEDLKSAVYLEDGEPAEELKTGLKSLLGERKAPVLVQSMKIIIEIDNEYIPKITAETLSTGTGVTTGTMQYKKYRKSIQGVMDCLMSIQQYAKDSSVAPLPGVEILEDDDMEVIEPDPIPGTEDMTQEAQEEPLSHPDESE